MSIIFINPYRFGRPWTPADITTALWLDADDAATITTVSGAVSQWNDKSGNNRNASQSVSNSRPVYNATGFNGKPCISFDGTDDQLDLVQFAQQSGQNIYAVVNTTDIGLSNRILLQRTSPAAENLAIYFNSNAAYRPSVYWSGFRAGWGSDVRSRAIFRWQFLTGAPASALTQVNGGTPVTETFTASQLTSWLAINNSAFQQSKIDLCELIIVSGSTAGFDAQKFDGYLAHKWGLAANLPSDHPYKSTAP